MFKTLASALKTPELRKKILITLLLLLVYRIGCYLPVPGILPDTYATQVGDDASILTLLNAVTGSALSNGAFLELLRLFLPLRRELALCLVLALIV